MRIIRLVEVLDLSNPVVKVLIRRIMTKIKKLVFFPLRQTTKMHEVLISGYR